jgi:hypothetical protein
VQLATLRGAVVVELLGAVVRVDLADYRRVFERLENGIRSDRVAVNQLPRIVAWWYVYVSMLVHD